jgi:cell division control protein 45
MDIDLKSGLFTKVASLAPEYGLNDLTYPSFIRKSGYKSDISSSDAVEGLGALLEVATGVRLDFGNGNATGGGREEWSEGIKGWVEKEGKEGGGREEEEGGEKKDGHEEWGRRNFWLAWDALSPE